MVFTNGQTISFFEAPTQMAIPADTRLQLQTEGINTVDDLSEFDDDNLKQISENLRRPSGRVPTEPNNPDGPTIPTPPFVFGAKILNCLKAASAIARSYESIGRAPTVANMSSRSLPNTGSPCRNESSTTTLRRPRKSPRPSPS
jgi:hypothetical protein